MTNDELTQVSDIVKQHLQDHLPKRKVSNAEYLKQEAERKRQQAEATQKK